ncbi:mannonate dehydratase [Gilvimarinus sp. SDUM040013]|uniref:Mannonate dehydratase n=1 Tax=Gilvimarinus gilvus TaxID=3058038 RepID=A0ABU4S5N8_9GAMM|nr:mannonate dehydratase [Gilvimarinus sp. SDUM040013]MDO3385794.1 mannonate dehydratase [Gilvimarinus sp. SDUM040013]MDX6850644.1 mannonate dehydratase [Gilvimarinus sp. SDUM040013]
MKETWRWFGPQDTVTLANIRQAGASGIVTSLHHIATGEVWPREEIKARKQLIEAAGLEWSVIESIPLHNDIKTRTGDYERYIANYLQSLRNVAAEGVFDVCYNFMPVVDWTRTNLSYNLPNQSQALRFEISDFAAYDVYILERPNAAADYAPEVLDKAKARLDAMSGQEKDLLEKNIIAGLPGGEGSYDRDGIRAAIEQFIALGDEGMRTNLFAFLRAVVPVAEEVGVRLAIHPDDPPFSLFGLPRVVSTQDDARALLAAVKSPANGLTLCAGSYGARGDNDLVDMVREFGDNIYFVHLRNIKREADGSFYESDHLDGDNDMVGLIGALIEEESRRRQNNSALPAIAMRPDHGHLMGDEIGKAGINPGYSYAGRMRGLAELRGVIHTLETLNSRAAL